MESGLTQIRLEVEARLANPVFVARMIGRVAESLTSRRVKEINRVVGRAMNAMPDSKYWTRELKDYQQYLERYVALKRRLGLFRKKWLNAEMSDEEVPFITGQIASLTQEVKEARAAARELRHQVWYGHFQD